MALNAKQERRYILIRCSTYECMKDCPVATLMGAPIDLKLYLSQIVTMEIINEVSHGIARACHIFFRTPKAAIQAQQCPYLRSPAKLWGSLFVKDFEQSHERLMRYR